MNVSKVVNFVRRSAHLSFGEHALEDAAASNAALEVVDFAAWLVHVKGANDNEPRRRQEVSLRDWDLSTDVLIDHFDVVSQLSGDGNHRRTLCNRA